MHHFRFAAASWSYIDSIDRPFGGTGTGFGEAIARSGDLVAVGAPFGVLPGQSHGAVHIFRLTAGQWLVEDVLGAIDGAATDRFGASLAFVGERLIGGRLARLTVRPSPTP